MINNPTRITITLALMVLALGGYILFVDIPQTREFKKKETQERALLPFDDRDITVITWATAAETIQLERDQKYRWTITQPMQSPADNQEVRRIIRALTIGKIKRIIEDGPETLEKYGLNPPYLTLTLNTPTATQTLALGDRGPFAPSLYVQTKTDGQVVITTLDVMTFAQKSLPDFRLKDLLFFDREHVHEIHIQHADTSMVMARIAGVHSLSPNWMFTSPIKTPADKITVGTLLMELSGLRATGFVDSEADKQRILSQPSRAHVGLTLLEGPRTHYISLYQFQNPGKAYAITSSTGPLYEISPKIMRPITQGTFHFQDKRLFGLEYKEVVLLDVITPQEHYVLIKQHDDWILENEPNIFLDQKLVNLFVSRVVDLPTEIAHPEGSTTPSQTALDMPTVTIRGRSRQGEKSGLLVLGKREKGLVYAKGAGHKGIYQVRSTILDQIPTKAQLIQ